MTTRSYKNRTGNCAKAVTDHVDNDNALADGDPGCRINRNICQSKINSSPWSMHRPVESQDARHADQAKELQDEHTVQARAKTSSLQHAQVYMGLADPKAGATSRRCCLAAMNALQVHPI